MIEIRNLSFGYPNKPLLFKDLALTLNKGHIYGLLGKNGAGKSTLLKNITGLAFPAKGSCLFNGTNVANRPVSVLEDIYFIAEELYVPSLHRFSLLQILPDFIQNSTKKTFTIT